MGIIDPDGLLKGPQKAFFDNPGTAAIELPSLALISGDAHDPEMLMEIAEALIKSEENYLIVSEADRWQKEVVRLQKAADMAGSYQKLLKHFVWGLSVFEWIGECEYTFRRHKSLKRFDRPELWPYNVRASFITLLQAKKIPRNYNVDFELAAGAYLWFRKLPTLDYLSTRFLLAGWEELLRKGYTDWRGKLDLSHIIELDPKLFIFCVQEDEIYMV